MLARTLSVSRVLTICRCSEHITGPSAQRFTYSRSFYSKDASNFLRDRQQKQLNNDSHIMAAPYFNIFIVGDVMLGRIVNDSLTYNQDRKYTIWGTVAAWKCAKGIPNAITVGNLECAITSCTQLDPKAFNFKLAPEHVDVLVNFGFDLLALANNHVLDFLADGLIETVSVLNQVGIKHAGAGLAAEAKRPAMLERAGVKVAFFSFSDHYERWTAKKKAPGINYINPANFSREELASTFSAARNAGAALVVVAIHWGPNWQWEPDEDIVRLGHELIDAGADVVAGSSPHHLQGVEWHHGRPIIYSAGAFIDDYKLDPEFRNDIGCLYHLAFGPDLKPLWLDAVPTIISHHWLDSGPEAQAGHAPPYLSQVDLARGEDFFWAARKLTQLCGAFGTQVDVDPGRETLRLMPPHS